MPQWMTLLLSPGVVKLRSSVWGLPRPPEKVGVPTGRCWVKVNSSTMSLVRGTGTILQGLSLRGGSPSSGSLGSGLEGLGPSFRSDL